jgi:methyl-accepting chemotaxis protein
MAKVKATEEGVSALKKMAQSLTDSVETIKKSTSELQNVYEENKSSLAPHADSLGQVIEDVKQTSSEAAEPVDGLTEKVLGLAEKIQEFIDDDPFSGISGN